MNRPARNTIFGGILCLIAGIYAVMRPAYAYFDSGNQLYSLCQSSELWKAMGCMQTIVGHYDMMMSMGYHCGSDASKTKQQLRDVVMKYMADNPSMRSNPASDVSFIAFFQAFSCTFPAKTSGSGKN